MLCGTHAHLKLFRSALVAQRLVAKWSRARSERSGSRPSSRWTAKRLKPHTVDRRRAAAIADRHRTFDGECPITPPHKSAPGYLRLPGGQGTCSPCTTTLARQREQPVPLNSEVLAMGVDVGGDLVDACRSGGAKKEPDPVSSAHYNGAPGSVTQVPESQRPA